MDTKTKQQAQQVIEAQPVPYSEEAEAAVLGGIVVNPNAYFEVAQFLTPQDFFLLRHRHIFEAMQRMVARKDTIEYLTLVEELRAGGHLEEIGGAAYLTRLMNAADNSYSTPVYGVLVQRASIRRQLMQYGQDVVKIAADEKTELGDVIGKIEGRQIEIASKYTGARTQNMRTAVSSYYDRVEKLMSNPASVTGLPTGFKEFDKLLSGLNQQIFMILAGRPGMGKTAMMLSMVLNLAKAGARCGFFSMEMGVDQLIERLVAMESGINTQVLRTGQLTQNEWARFVKANGELSELPIFIDDTVTWTPLQLMSKCTSMQCRHGLDVVFVDYIGLMSGGGRYKDDKTRETGYISRSLKGMARDLRIPVVAAAQLSRKCEDRQDKRPQLADLRDSGDLEQDADVVTFLYRDEVYNEATEFPNQADVIIAKHRQGPTGTISLYFEKTLTKFMNASERSVDLSRI